jgi:hypothetical protein
MTQKPEHASSSKVPTKFFGKYRGTVQSNVDPLMLGRVMAEIPAVSFMSNWALPCTPYPANRAQTCAVPPIGAHVWIEFEGGDPDFPVWTGCFWSAGESSLLALP